MIKYSQQPSKLSKPITDSPTSTIEHTKLDGKALSELDIDGEDANDN